MISSDRIKQLGILVGTALLSFVLGYTADYCAWINHQQKQHEYLLSRGFVVDRVLDGTIVYTIPGHNTGSKNRLKDLGVP